MEEHLFGKKTYISFPSLKKLFHQKWGFEIPDDILEDLLNHPYNNLTPKSYDKKKWYYKYGIDPIIRDSDLMDKIARKCDIEPGELHSLPIGNKDEVDRSQELLDNDDYSYADLNESVERLNELYNLL